MAKEQSNEVELAGFSMPMNVRLPDSASSLMIGNHYNNGMGVGGIVKRITLSTLSGVITLHMETPDKKPIATRLFVFPTGMTAQEKAP